MEEEEGDEEEEVLRESKQMETSTFTKMLKMISNVPTFTYVTGCICKHTYFNSLE